MSPIFLEDQLQVDRVAVIGAGPCGLAAAKYLLAEKRFSKVEIFEQRSTPGGVWNYSSLNEEEWFTLPRVTPTTKPDQAIYKTGSSDAQFVSPVYDQLETNIPHTLMNYTDRDFPQDASLFPPHGVVLQYLKNYAEALTPYIAFQSQILDVRKNRDVEGACWEIEVLDLKTGKKRTTEFDAVVVASGHYNDPFIPNITGLEEFEKRLSGSIQHSKFYRRPEQYKDKKVIVVGNSASGIDLSVQLSSTARLPVLISEKEKPNPVAAAEEKKPWAENVPEIVEFLPERQGVRFANGRIEDGIDAVVFCTGYHYSFPFLRSLKPSVVVPDGSHAAHLWEHMLYTADPTLAFLSIPQRIVPFPVSEAQSGVIARMWSGRLSVPSQEAMGLWVDDLLKEKGANNSLHNLASPKDIEYINRLYKLSMTAKPLPGLENDGEGKRPPYWGEEKAWVRGKIPMIKVASRALGDERHRCRTLKELGFDYEEAKATAEASDKIL